MNQHTRSLDPPEAEMKTGAAIIWDCLEREGVELVFGYPGGAILPTYDELTRHSAIRHVLTRHEQGATHMADGYARASGRVGVVMATSGPGATNLVTGLGTAMMDSTPLVCITGQVPTTARGSDAFQEADTIGISQPVAKHTYLVADVDDLAFTLKEAFEVARSGRPGPVLVDVPKDVQLARSAEQWPEESLTLPGVDRCEHDDEADFERALALIHEAERPVILAGHGVLKSAAVHALKTFAERADIPIALTLLGKGGFAENHPLCLGMMGMHGSGVANRAIQQADLLLAFGMRFDDRVTGDLTTYARDARKIHLDIDPAEIGKNVKVDVGIVGDLRATLEAMLGDLRSGNRADWRSTLAEWRSDDHDRDVLNRAPDSDSMLAAEAIAALHRVIGDDAVNVTDVGQHQMWEAQYFPHQRPGTLFTSGGMGTMGFALPAALGVKLARPNEEVWAIVGDGGFQMTMAELATARQEGLEIKIAIINNGYLGMVRQWQEFFYEERYAETPMLSPDFCRIADAYGIPAIRVARREELEDAILAARKPAGPALLELVVEQHDAVFPMVPAGGRLDAMIRRPHSAEIQPRSAGERAGHHG